MNLLTETEKYSLYSKYLDILSSELHLLNDKPDETPSSTLGALWLTASGQPTSARDVPTDELPDLDSSSIEQLSVYVKRRLDGEPLAHITKRQQFMGIEYISSPDALIPRKETEILAKAAIEQIKSSSSNTNKTLVLDICTGAGNLAIAFAKNFKNSMVFGSDLCPKAVSLAKSNVAFHNLEDRVEILEGDLLSPFDSDRFYKKFDVITCNPPYISSAKVSDMDSEIASFEPTLAFDGGPFGIKILRRVINDAPNYLNNHGCLIFEVGLGQGKALMMLVKKSKKYSEITPVYDEHNQIRAIKAHI